MKKVASDLAIEKIGRYNPPINKGEQDDIKQHKSDPVAWSADSDLLALKQAYTLLHSSRRVPDTVRGR
jgi:hypothetical protein